MNKITQKLREIEESLNLIQEALPADVEEFKALKLVKDGIYKRLEFCIQNLIDIFSVVYSQKKLGVPSTLDDIFEGLEKEKVFPQRIITLVREMKGLRNILIHKYGKIDDTLLHELFIERWDDFEEVIKAVEEHLHTQQIPKNIKK